MAIKTVVMEITELLSKSFEKWLNTLGYAKSTVYASVRYVNDFFFYLKSQEITDLEQINTSMVKTYHKHLQTRNHKGKGGGLSQNYIASNFNALKRFSRYLQVTGKANLEITLQTPVNKDTAKTILTQDEIKSLYHACDNDIYGIRDRAMLSIYYGCGLRRSEGASLDVKDVMLKEKLVFVRGGKGYKERYVPMTEAVKEDLENYLYQARENLLNGVNINQEPFFVSYRATRMCGNALLTRLNFLVEKAQINKSIGIHSLRHSIATHLLQSSLSLEEVSQFLGHSSLESTQIYTHLAHA
jgi:integrase/recombinase XerD